MNITPEQFLTKLAASPADGREFDSYAPPGMSRRAHVELTLAQVENSCTNVAESKTLADQRKINATLKSDLAKATARLKFLTPEATVVHNLHAAPGFKKAVGPAKQTKAVAPAAAQLDRIKSPGTNRREAVEAVLAAGKAALAENVALKNKLLAAKQKQVALLQAKARLATNNSQSMNSQPPAAPSATHTAASFSAPKLTMLRKEFDKLSPTDARSFLAQKGKILA